jgi:hypothetical protein
MDPNALLNSLTSLALLYGWALFAAAVFALGERACRSLFAQRQPAPAPSSAKEPGKS